MCGGGGLQTVVEVLSDIAATATGNPEFIPLINGAETAGFNVAEGQGVGKSLTRGAVSGAEALAGQEAAGAVGVGSGNSIFNNALNITGDNPAGTGLPDLGAAFNNVFGSASGEAGTASQVGSSTAQGTPIPGTAPATGTNFGGPSGAISAAPAGVGGGGGDVTLGDPTGTIVDTTSNPISGAGGAGSAASSGNVSQTTGTPSVSSQPSVFDTAGGNSGRSISSVASGIPTSFPSPQSAATGVSGGLGPEPGALDNMVSGTSVASASGGVTPADVPNSISTAFHNPTLSNIGKAFSANAGSLASGAGLVSSAVMNQGALKGQKEISDQAGKLAAQGNALQNYLQTGTLPPGLQGALDEASSQAVATIKSQYAAHGMSGSSAERDAIDNVQQNVASQGAQMALQLLQTGINESEGAAQLYQGILNTSLSQDESLSGAIGKFANAASGGNPNTTINIGGAQKGTF